MQLHENLLLKHSQSKLYPLLEQRYETKNANYSKQGGPEGTSNRFLNELLVEHQVSSF